MTAASVPFAGWTLSEALERVADRKSWSAWVQAKAAWEKVHGPITEDAVDLPGDEQERGPEWQRVAGAFAAMRKELWRELANQKVAAAGQRGNDAILFKANDWRDFTHVQWRDSIIENPATGERLTSVRIYPLVHAPDAAHRLVGLSLGEAFFKCVLEDPEVQSIQAEVTDDEYGHAAVFRDGQYPGPNLVYTWPLDVTPSDLAFHFVKPIISYVGQSLREASAEIHRLCEVIVDRLQALRGLLVKGSLIARGTHVTTGNVVSVDVFQWRRKGLLLDVQNADVSDAQKHPPTPLWTGLALHAGPTMETSPPQMDPAPVFPVKPTPSDRIRPTALEPHDGEHRRSKGIARAETKMATRTACREMLTEIIAASPGVRTHSKDQLLRMARERWPDLSERAFDQARQEALRAVPKSSAWSSSGAPTKSGREQSPR